MDAVPVTYVNGHLRTGRYSQRERPAVTLPSRLLGSRYGVESQFHLSWEPILASAEAATLSRLMSGE